MLPLVQAERFAKVMGSGRTRPLLLGCVDDTGTETELVVKLRNQPQIAPGGLLAEAVSSLLAQDLGIPVPQPFRVRVEADFARTLPDAELRAVAERSVGLNFGCQVWKPGHSIWPRDKRPSRESLRSAMEIFAFDGLIQNPDRRAKNPNCVHRGDDLLIFDHESAFSLFLDLLPKPPWEPGGLAFLNDHIFRAGLRGETLDLKRFQGALETIDEARIMGYLAAVPPDWSGPSITPGRIKAHLLDCITHFKRIHLQLQALL
jgi:hypothetical protein